MGAFLYDFCSGYLEQLIYAQKIPYHKYKANFIVMSIEKVDFTEYKMTIYCVPVLDKLKILVSIRYF